MGFSVLFLLVRYAFQIRKKLELGVKKGEEKRGKKIS
jgi:hypothetical protein